MNANATRIDDLPGGSGPAVSPSLPSALEPISTSVHEQAQSAPAMLPQMGGGAPIYNPNAFSPSQTSQQVSSDTINQIMSTINMAGNQLPSRDIPMMNPHDNQSRPNYIPENNNYVQQYSDFAEIARQNKEKDGKQGDIFERLQTPIMCAVIFFLFQLPIVRKSLFKYLPSLYFTDGNPKISALLIQAISVAVAVYLLNTFTQ
uniref:Uncharacterized protein n=1 Tax=viral metagenome TaxID=1070528 RepID=A0A6C0BTJ1_9ZZZZ